MIPITRKELYLNKIVGNNDYSIPEKPISEEEFFFAEILGEAVQAPEPFTRYQMYLAKIAKREIEIPYPETRLEYFLAKAAGMDITVPAPITREEIYWSNYTAIMEFEVENVPPLAYKAIEGTLKNYRIYGNTVNAASVGDRTANLFDENLLDSSIWSDGTWYFDNHVLKYTATNDQRAWRYNSAQFKFTLKAGTYTISTLTVKAPEHNQSYAGWILYNSDGQVLAAKYGDSFISKNINFAMFKLSEETKIGFCFKTMDGEYQIMLNEGSTPLPYEPYGYKVPVTVSNGTDTLTTSIYLPEQIKKVGDEAEYIDYAEQKLHRVGAEDIDVTLPVLPTVTGTNVLSVGTEVQPSKVYIKGEKEREYT